MKFEFNYCILKKGQIVDPCFAYVEIQEEEILEIIKELMEVNSEGKLTDMPDKYVRRFVDAALEDAITIYPNFDDEKEEFSVMLQKYLPEELLEYFPDELINSFSPDMFDITEEPNPTSNEK